jgi:uncharacterized protein
VAESRSSRILPLVGLPPLFRIVDNFPHEVREIEHISIPLPDGQRLAAKLWLPADAHQTPVPALIEYLPYRKRDGTRWRDEPIHRYFAGNGYASLRIDLRGSGESEGVLLDEYLPQELIDAVAAIQWIASRPWCTGAVGMFGKSWGGINSLQVAALAPPELKAIITVCASDDRYLDDAHYMGGCLLTENLVWGSVLLTINAQAPDPSLVRERWREMWLERIDASPLFPALWMQHPRNDEYWRQGSLAPHYDRVKCPVLAYGGQADGYTNAVPRLLSNLEVPCCAVVGPWAHLYPHEGEPGPAIGFLQEAVRWWDQWLKGIDRGVGHDPIYRAWLGGANRWIAERAWPPNVEPRKYRLRADGTIVEPGRPRGAGGAIAFSSAESVGITSGSWCPFGPDELPMDQTPDDARSIVFDTALLMERLDILGEPMVELCLSSDRPNAIIAVRLGDVAPDGSIRRVSYAILNLTHRDSHASPEPLVPGERFKVRIALKHVVHSFAPGHRVRVALSTSYWPVAWPSPERAELSIWPEESTLELPFRPREKELGRNSFPPPEAAPPIDSTEIKPAGTNTIITREAGVTTIVVRSDVTSTGDLSMHRAEQIGLEVGHGIRERYMIKDGDPTSAVVNIKQRYKLQRDNWSTTIVTDLSMRSTKDEFLLDAKLEAFEGDRKERDRRWELKIPRDLV